MKKMTWEEWKAMEQAQRKATTNKVEADAKEPTPTFTFDHSVKKLTLTDIQHKRKLQ
jgi:hypothetical protein